MLVGAEPEHSVNDARRGTASRRTEATLPAPMRRWPLLLAALTLLVAACGGGGGGTASASSESAVASGTPDTPTTSAPSTPTDGGGEGTTSTAEPSLRPEGPAAPDFTLALGDGSTFTLSDEQKPVYMVFWAEW